MEEVREYLTILGVWYCGYRVRYGHRGRRWVRGE